MTTTAALGFAKTVIRSNLETLKEPYRLNFSTTYLCQSRCVMCNIWERKPVGELTLEEIQKFASKNTSFRWVQLTGGEPFLRQDITEIARAFMDTSPIYILTMPTNSLCSVDLIEKRVREILSLKPSRYTLTLSLDGYRELHDEIRGIRGNFDRVMSVYRRLKPLEREYSGFRVIFGYTIIKKNSLQLLLTIEAVRRLFPDVKENDFHLNLGQLSEHYYGNSANDFEVSRADAEVTIDSSIARRKTKLDLLSFMEGRWLSGLSQYVKTGKGPSPTRELEASLFLDSFGNVFPSIMWNDSIGNIRGSNFELKPLWNSESAERIRSYIRRGTNPPHWTSCESYSSILGDLL